MLWTPVVFWAVRAVMAVMAKTPFMVMVLRSAWIPAPPLESLPAMDNAVFMGCSFLSGRGSAVLRHGVGQSPELPGGGGDVRRPNRAETTAAPAAPEPCSCRILRAFTPPMATTGMRTARQTACSPA